MSIQDFYQGFAYMNVGTYSDGMGGIISKYVEGNRFQAGISTNSRREIKSCGKNTEASEYIIATDIINKLNHDQIIKQISNGKYYRIVNNSDSLEIPMLSDISWHEVGAELFVVP